MTTPVLPVYVENFGATSWRSGEWTEQTSSTYDDNGPATFSIVSGTGRMAITGSSYNIAQSTPSKLVCATAWKDTKITSFDLTATMGKSGYSTDSVNGWGILFSWDGSIDAANGYILHTTKHTTLAISKIVNGTFSALIAGFGSPLQDARNIRLRMTPSGAGNLIQALAIDSFSTTGTGGWSDIVDATHTAGGRIAICSFIDFAASDSGASTLDSSDYVSVSNLRISRLGTSAGVATSGVPLITGNAALTSGSSTTNASSYTTASLSAGTANLGAQLHIAIFASTTGAATAHACTGAGLTWTVVSTIQHASNARRLTMFQATGIRTAGALTFTAGATTEAAQWAVMEIRGAANGSLGTLPAASIPAINSSTALAGTASTTAVATPALKLPSVSPHVLLIMAVSANIATSAGQFTAGSGSTELLETSVLTPTGNMGVFYTYSPSSTTISAEMTSSNTYGAVAAIIQPSISYPPFDGNSVSRGGAG